eukprot:s976_g21.t1
MLEATGFPDMGVVSGLQQGADLTGEVPITNMLPGKFDPALISEKELCANAKRLRRLAENDMGGSGDSFIDETVWSKTLEEVEKGWLVGPLRFFRSLVLPFGAVRSVHSFLRLARALWWIGVKGCRVVWTSFYDDFIAFSKPVLTGSTEKVVGLLFKLLGWVFAEEGDKAELFNPCCSALGVLFDLSAAHKGLAFVKTTEARRAELCHDLSEVIADGRLQSKQAQKLRGRMQVAEAQLFGRTGRVFLSAGERCYQKVEDYKKQIIFEAETLAAVVAAMLWKEELNAKRGVLFVDSEGTKFALLKGLSENTCVDLLAEFFVAMECDIHSTVWIGRVPSKSNIADPPSRGIVNTKLLEKGTDVSKQAEAVLKDLVTQMEKLGEKAAPDRLRLRKIPEGSAMAIRQSTCGLNGLHFTWQRPAQAFFRKPTRVFLGKMGTCLCNPVQEDSEEEFAEENEVECDSYVKVGQKLQGVAKTWRPPLRCIQL